MNSPFQKKYLYVPLSLMVLLSSACSHRIYLPDTASQFPESGGGLGTGVAGVHIGSTTSVKVINDYAATPPVEGVKKIEDSSFMPYATLNLGIGLSSDFELYYNRSFGLRHQLTGDSKNMGWKSSAFLGVIATGTQRTTETTTTATSTTSYTRESKLSGYDTGFSIGYRQTAKSIFYFTISRLAGEANTQVTHPNAVTYKFDDSFSHNGLSLGIKGGDTWYVLGEVSVLYTDWSEIGGKTSPGLAAGFGYDW